MLNLEKNWMIDYGKYSRNNSIFLQDDHLVFGLEVQSGEDYE